MTNIASNEVNVFSVIAQNDIERSPRDDGIDTRIGTLVVGIEDAPMFVEER